MLREALIVAVLATAAAGCGSDEKAATPTKAKAAVSDPSTLRDRPYAVTCADVTDSDRSLEFKGGATAVLAAEARMPDMQEIWAAKSIWYAMTELCKGKQPTFKPAKAAVAAVRSGKYRAG